MSGVMNSETETFDNLCLEVVRKVARICGLSECEPGFLKILDWILAHPQDRELCAAHFRNVILTGAGADYCYLIAFCMRSMQWPEIVEAVKLRSAQEIHNSEGASLQEILNVYKVHAN